MRNSKREGKYIGFLVGMIVTMLLCFGLICVTAEPAAEPETTDPAVEATADPVATQEVPVETTVPPTEPVVTDLPTQEDPTSAVPTATQQVTPTQQPTQTQQPTKTPGKTTPPATTAAPTTGGVVPETTEPPVSQTPTEDMPTATVLPTLLPTLTPTPTPTPTLTPVDTKPPFTMGPIDKNELLPQYSPQITPGMTAAPTAPTDTSEPTAPAESSVDMHGYVIRIAAAWDEYQDAMLNTEAIAAFETKYNCKVLFLDLSEDALYNRLLMSKATGVTYFDAVLVEGTEILVNLQPLGLVQSFSRYMTDTELAALPVSYQKFLSKDGTLYGIPAKAPDVSGLWYNPAVEKQYQYGNPLNVYKSGNWDWNQLTSFFKEATRDLDNDGFYNTYGLTTSSPWYFSVMEATGGSMFRWTGSQFLPGATNAVSIQGLSFVRNVYLNHYVASDYERYFYTGQAPYLAGELSMYAELKSYLQEKLLFLPYPSVTGTAPYQSVATSVPSAAITATAVYPEQTAELLKILYGGDALNQRIAAYCTESGFSEQIQETYLTMLEDFTVDYTTAFDASGTIRLKTLSLLKNQSVSATTLQENIEPLLEQAIAEKSKKINLEEVPVEIRW